MKYYLVHVDCPRVGRLLYIVAGEQDTWFDRLDASAGGMHEILHEVIDESINNAPAPRAPARPAREGELRIDIPRRAGQIFVTGFYEVSEEIAMKHTNLYPILEI